jgi:S1-C subfamily serine protease
VLIALDATPLEKVEDLQAFCASGVMGKAVKAKFIRGGALAESNIVLGERPRA